MPKTRVCKDCKKRKPITSFSPNSASRDGFRIVCKPCVNVRNRAHYRRNPQRHQDYQRAFKYGISPAEQQGMREAQQGRCAICLEERPLVLDHCHSTGKVRGFLCHPCNAGLGFFKDNPDRLLAAASYLVGVGGKDGEYDSAVRFGTFRLVANQ